MTDPSCAVTVTDRAGHSRQANGRAARMLLAVLFNQDKINAARRGRFILHFGQGLTLGDPELVDLLKGVEEPG